MASNLFVLIAVTFLMTCCLAAPNGNKDVIKVPEECKKEAGLCNVKPEGYDDLQEKINSLLPPNLKESFGDRDGTMELTESPKEDEDNCPYTTETQPMYLYTRDNVTTHDIIIQTDMLVQMVERVKCISGHSKASYENPDNIHQCFKKLGLNKVTETVCHQAYTYIDLFVYIPEEEKIVMKPYRVETCCSCRLVNSVNRVL